MSSSWVWKSRKLDSFSSRWTCASVGSGGAPTAPGVRVVFVGPPGSRPDFWIGELRSGFGVPSASLAAL